MDLVTKEHQTTFKQTNKWRIVGNESLRLNNTIDANIGGRIRLWKGKTEIKSKRKQGNSTSGIWKLLRDIISFIEINIVKQLRY